MGQTGRHDVVCSSVIKACRVDVWHDDESELKKRRTWVNFTSILNPVVNKVGPDGLRLYSAYASELTC